MRTVWGVGVLLLVALPAARAAAAGRVDEAAVDAAVKRALEAWEVPGAAVVIVHGDEVVYLKGHGVRERGTDKPVTPDTVFPVASCTKGFTTALLAMLVDEGKLGWDDRVRKHLPWFRLADPLADEAVTIRDLVTHRTGLRGHEMLWYRAPWPPEEAVRRAAHLPLDGPFRGTFLYQSTMFTAAGLAAGAAAGSTWDDLIRKRLFEPLGMKNATTVFPAGEGAQLCSPHRKRPSGEVAVVPWYQLTAPDPAGTIHATARDLGAWLRFQVSGGVVGDQRLVSAAALAETHMPQIALRLEGVERQTHPETHLMSYGMGWTVQDYRGRLLVSHAGILEGFRCHFTLLPKDGWGLAILSNVHATRMNLALSNTIVDLLTGMPARDWHGTLLEVVRQDEEAARVKQEERLAKRKPGTSPSREARAYLGTYEHPAYGAGEVEWRNGGLVWNWGKFSCPLEHFHFDTFVVRHEFFAKPFVTFRLNDAGEVASLHIGMPFDVTFTRKAA